MEPKDYILVKIEGEYAYLREIGESDPEKDIYIAQLFLLWLLQVIKYFPNTFMLIHHLEYLKKRQKQERC